MTQERSDLELEIRYLNREITKTRCLHLAMRERLGHEAEDGELITLADRIRADQLFREYLAFTGGVEYK